jgi:integrase
MLAGKMKGRYFMTKKQSDPVKAYKLQSGETLYKFHIYLGVDQTTGKEIRVGRQGFVTKKEARMAIARLKLEFEESQTVFDQRTKRIKFEEVYELWFEQYRNTVKESTFSIEKPRADKHVLPKFKGMFVEKINLHHCQKVVNKWYKTYNRASLLISVFNRIMAFAKTQGYIQSNPMLDVIRPKNQDKEEYEAPFYDKWQLNEFLNAVKETDDLQQIAAFRLLAYTGLRKGELHGLQWKDIDFNRGLLSVKRVLTRGENNEYYFQTPKTKSSIRDISLDDETMDIVNRYRMYQKETLFKFGHNSNSPDQLLFTDIHNNYLKLEYFNRKLTKIIKEHHLPHMTIHGFRHTHCSLLFDAGEQIKVVQNRLGHSSAETTMNIYSHVMKNRKRETGNKFAAYMQL